MTDRELVEAWATQKSDLAFAELVRRYLDLVYAAALRQVRDPQLAEEVVQAVFLVLARKAGSLRRETVIAGWLFCTTRFIAARAIRAESRRHRHEQEAATMNPQATSSETDNIIWVQIAPLLDEAIGSLSSKDRDAVLLRFFQSLPMGKIGERLGLSEEAVKKRISRALEKLRCFFVRRGITLSAALIGGALSQNAVQAAAPGLSLKITAAQAAALAGGNSAVLATEALRQLCWFKLRSALFVGIASLALLLLVNTFLPGENPASQASSVVQQNDEVRLIESLSEIRGNLEIPAPEAARGKTFLLAVRAAADNQPIPGTRVLAQWWAERGVAEKAEFRSDTNGLCEIPLPSQAYATFRIWLSAEGFVPKVMDWQSYELADHITSYTTKLERGLKIEGLIRDDQGLPVAGAKIHFSGPGMMNTERENAAFHPQFSAVESDRSGQFLSTQMPSKGDGLWLVVTHRNFAGQSQPVLLPEGLDTNWIVILNGGVPLTGRVVDIAGEPINGATVWIGDPHGEADASTTSDARGGFEFAHLAPGASEVQVSAADFKGLTRNILVESNAAPLVLELQREVSPATAPFRL